LNAQDGLAEVGAIQTVQTVDPENADLLAFELKRKAEQ
jgi:hypothetical protein